MNPHKWMGVPVDLSVLFCRRMNVLKQAFSLVPEYLRTDEPEGVKNFMDYGPQLGRRFRALKLWFVMRYFGAEGLAAVIRGHIELARQFAEWVDASDGFERMAPVPLSTVCFRCRPRDLRGASESMELYLETLNQRVLDEVNRRGRVFLSHTKLGGRFVLRLAVGNFRTRLEHIRLAWEELGLTLSRLDQELRPETLRDS
jgi:aromatic-L-amino-acid decarboxylase